LNLESKPHPRPYKLQWLSKDGEIGVNKQVKICFYIGNYHGSALCDVVPMEASHVLLGRPWQFDKRANHDGYSNKYSFVHNERKVTLVPLSPREVCEDQKKLREKREQENKKMREKKRKVKRKRENDENQELKFNQPQAPVSRPKSRRGRRSEKN